jgi:hypothetical protein
MDEQTVTKDEMEEVIGAILRMETQSPRCGESPQKASKRKASRARYKSARAPRKRNRQ